jgi:hypothetical protein
MTADARPRSQALALPATSMILLSVTKGFGFTMFAHCGRTRAVLLRQVLCGQIPDRRPRQGCSRCWPLVDGALSGQAAQ